MKGMFTTFADCNAMSLPGRMPKMKDYTVMMLPGDVTKAYLWRTYTRACGDLSSKTVGHQMQEHHTAVMKNSSDLCDTCQQNNNLILKSVDCTDDEKSALLKQQEKHIAFAKECRAYYR